MVSHARHLADCWHDGVVLSLDARCKRGTDILRTCDSPVSASLMGGGPTMRSVLYGGLGMQGSDGRLCEAYQTTLAGSRSTRWKRLRASANARTSIRTTAGFFSPSSRRPASTPYCRCSHPSRHLQSASFDESRPLSPRRCSLSCGHSFRSKD